MTSPPRVVAALYGWLLRLYPRRMRARFSEELRQLFVDDWREATGAGRWALLALVGRTLRDVAVNAFITRLERRGRAGRITKRTGAPRFPERGNVLSDLRHDLRYAARSLGNAPAFTVVVVITLALGIGANTALFSVVNGVLLESLPYPQPERLVQVWQSDRLRGTTLELASAPDFFDWEEQNTVFSSLAAYTLATTVARGGDGRPQQVRGTAVTHAFFGTLGVEPLLGRGFTPGEDAPGGDRVLVLSHGYWLRQFAGDPDIVGSTVFLDEEPVTVVGVMPAGFGYPSTSTEYWVPLQAAPNTLARGSHSFGVVARLRDGVALEEANADVQAIMRRLEEQYPDDNKGRSAWVQRTIDATVGTIRPALLTLFGSVGLVLLIACANVANLFLSRAIGRVREVAVRCALGARRSRLVRQFLTESVVLAFISAALGVGLAAAGIRLLVAWGGSGIPRVQNIAIDVRVLGFTGGVALLTGLLFGLIPALHAARPHLLDRLREGTRGAGASRRREYARRGVVVLELALAVVLVTGAGLLMKSFWRLQQVDPGFVAENVITFDLQLANTRYPLDFGQYPRMPETTRFFTALLERAETVPGVRRVSLALHHPMRAGWTSRFAIDGRPAVDPGEQDEVRIRSVSDGYFQTVGVPLLRGRQFGPHDREAAPDVVIINEAFARAYFQHEDPIGKRISFWNRSREVVGVVGDVRFLGVSRRTPPAVYPPLHQVPFNTQVAVLVQAAGDPQDVVPSLQQVIEDVDPQVPIYDVNVLTDLLTSSVAQPRFNMMFMLTFAGVAFALATVGIYGVISYAVSQRTAEIGLRMSLGAGRPSILRLVVMQGAKLTLIGMGLGLAGALLLTRVLSSLLFGVTTTDPLTFLAVTLMLSGTSLIACYVPARRATRVDPVEALRYE